MARMAGHLTLVACRLRQDGLGALFARIDGADVGVDWIRVHSAVASSFRKVKQGHM